MPLPYLCNVNLRDENLRSYKKKFTGPRGSKNFWSSESHQASMNGRVVTEVDEVKITRNEDTIVEHFKLKDYGTESKSKGTVSEHW